jgi:hypothetical protein
MSISIRSTRAYQETPTSDDRFSSKLEGEEIPLKELTTNHSLPQARLEQFWFRRSLHIFWTVGFLPLVSSAYLIFCYFVSFRTIPVHGHDDDENASNSQGSYKSRVSSREQERRCLSLLFRIDKGYSYDTVHLGHLTCTVTFVQRFIRTQSKKKASYFVRKGTG